MKTNEFWDKSCNGTDKSNEMPHLWGNIIVCVLRPLARLFWRVKLVNKDIIATLNSKTGFVMISNHTSFLDVFCLYVFSRFKQWPRFMARDTLFNSKALGFLLSRAGAFPIKRDTADRQAIKRASRMLKNKEIVGIMPEGTRRAKGSRKPTLHAGAAFIARMGGNVPIVPAAVVNIDKVKQKGKLPRFPKITIIYGNPILLEDFNFLPKEERLEACTWYAMRQCFAMFNKCDIKDVDMADLFPENKDYTKIFDEHKIPVHKASEVVKRYE